VREVDLVAWLGGDEFAVLLKDLPEDADQVAARIIEAIALPFASSNGTASVGASIGVVVADGGTRSAEQLLNDADTAMYLPKGSGKGGYRVFAKPSQPTNGRARAAG
jgi:diguanylate cyclase (GGDEF)-like protein